MNNSIEKQDKIPKKKTIILIGNVAETMLNFRKSLIQEIIKQGHTLYCLVFSYTKEQENIIFSWGAIPIEHTLNTKGLNAIKDIRAVWQFYKIFKRLKPDIVFSTFVKPVIFASLAAWFAKVPHKVGMIEGLGAAFTFHKIKNKITQKFSTRIIRYIQIFLYRLTLPRLDVVLLLNSDDKKDLIEQYKISVKQVIILGAIGVPLKDFPFQRAVLSPVTFIFVARLLKEKGIFEYLNAAQKVKEKYPHVIFYVLGGFDEKNPLALKRKDLEKFLLQETIIYAKDVSNVHDWLIKSSVFVLPSYREGFPRSTQEAMATGRAIITTNVAGCRETIVEDKNGFLVEPYSANALADKMFYFIENPQKIIEMGRESYKIAKRKFDAQKINKRLIKILAFN